MIEELFATISARKTDPKEGSYTNYLFDKGLDKILKKVGEEASEVIIAAKNADDEELVGELSDLLFHSLVLMAERGLTLGDIRGELERREGKLSKTKDRPEIDNL
ncbi:MAG: phosphoribosyl-ATP diphosphatase [Lactobacillales bacterium]|jgi:phosphoribosyl-ATP pyrophosphohydrolase|nr:phosphoribosyl-ATP diphosphatase [Lactobacillales bacterium]